MTHLFLETARPLAFQAADRLMELRLSPLVRERKADHSLVTNADKEADAIIRGGLRRAFPDHSILTEESGFDGSRDAEFVWVVDPLDGTKAYAAGVTGFSVMVGLLRHGKPYAGVVIDPLEGHAFEAVKGEGAFHTFQNKTARVAVSRRQEWHTMPVVTSTGFPESFEKILKKYFTSEWLPAVNSVGVKVGYVVQQKADIYINHHHVHYWDTCAPQIILEEADGLMTYADGGSLQYDLALSHFRHNAPTLATNGLRHQDVVAQLKNLKRLVPLK